MALELGLESVPWPNNTDVESRKVEVEGAVEEGQKNAPPTTAPQ